MKLLFLDSRNFLSLSDRICFEKDKNPQKRTIIVGPNNVGKTNVTRALKFIREVCENTFRGQPVSFVNKYSGGREFKLKIGFRLDKEEREDLNLFVKTYAESTLKKINISNNDITKIKKEPFLNKEEIKKFLSKTLKEAAPRLLQFIFIEKLSSASIIVRYIEDGSPLVHVELNVDEDKIKLDSRNCICKINVPNSFPVKDFKSLLIEFLEENNEVEIESLLNFILERGCLSLGDIGISEVDEEKRRSFKAILYKYNYPLEPGRIINLYYFLLHMFASRIILLDEIRTRSLKQIKDEHFKKEIESHSPYYYGTGEDLALFLFKLKNSQEKKDRETYHRIEDLFKEFTGLKFDVSISSEYPASKEKSSICYKLVGNRNCVIILDEPALHLHPAKQRKLMGLIDKAEESINQFIIITHSPYLIGIDSLEDVLRFNLEENKTKVYPVVNIFNQGNEDKIKKEFILNPHYKNILFAKGVIIVEGESEEIGVRYLLQKAGFSLEEHDVEIFNAHGDTHFEISAKTAKMLNIPYVIVCDKKAFSQIPGELQSDVFHFGEDDFVEFLDTEFSAACKRIKGLKAINSKPLKTMRVLQELNDEELENSQKVKKLAEFVKEKILK